MHVSAIYIYGESRHIRRRRRTLEEQIIKILKKKLIVPGQVRTADLTMSEFATSRMRISLVTVVRLHQLGHGD